VLSKEEANMNDGDNVEGTGPQGPAFIPETMQRAAALHNEGDLESAEALYRKVLEADPENPDALHLLGFLANQLGFWEEGAQLIEAAIDSDPNQPLFHNHLAKTFLTGGEKKKAEAAYRHSLELKNDSDVMNDLGNLLRDNKLGRGGEDLHEAIDLLNQAVLINPDSPQYRVNLGNALRDDMQLKEARSCYEKALEINPGFVGALSNFGLICSINGDFDEAIEYFDKALAIDPNDFGTLNNYGSVFVSKRQLDKGIEYFSRAAENETNNPLIYFNLGRALMRLRRDEEALEMLSKSLELDNNQPLVISTFASTLRMMENFVEAEKFTKDALDIFPDNPVLRCELAAIHQSLFEIDEAEILLRSILNDTPNFAPAVMTLAFILIHTGEEEEVMALFNKALELLPDEPEVPFNYALALFCYGHLEEAWENYVNRWDNEQFSSPVRYFPQKQWDGSSLEGKSILVYGEQGLGDEVRHASMIPDIMATGAEVTIECSARLVDLFQRSFEGAKVFPANYEEAESGEVDFDFQTPVIDLGRYFRPTIESFPSDPTHAFLKPDPEKKALWGERLKALGDNPKVGLSWRSGHDPIGRNKWGTTIEEMEPILSIEGVDFINLMYLECSEDRAKIQEQYGVTLHTWDDIDLKDDQDDLAALVANLDLVVSYPTSVGYLASGLAVPVFTFMAMNIHQVLLGNPDAPGWAPSMRFFCKHINENWDATFQNVAAEMRAKLGL
jgi:tetratricopeptide (TPR) repeat protein